MDFHSESEKSGVVYLGKETKERMPDRSTEKAIQVTRSSCSHYMRTRARSMQLLAWHLLPFKRKYLFTHYFISSWDLVTSSNEARSLVGFLKMD